jgi:hypothetical protein
MVKNKNLAQYLDLIVDQHIQGSSVSVVKLKTFISLGKVKLY